MPVVVFLSAVTAEFAKPDPANPRAFQSYRDALAAALRRAGPGYQVIAQEDLAQGFGDLLDTLDGEVAKSNIVVHLVGAAAGATPGPAAVRRLKERHPAFLNHEPELAAGLADLSAVSFTQWELYLAFEHRRGRLVYVAEPTTVRSPAFEAGRADESQERHLRRLKGTDEHREPFEDQRDLALKVLASVMRYGIGSPGPQAAPTEAAVAAARENRAELAHEVAGAIRKPDAVAAAAMDPTGVAVFLRAVDTAALKRELDRRTALELIAENRAAAREAASTEPTVENLRDLAFAELAAGHYPQAVAAARRAAATAEERLRAVPDQGERHREDVVNAYLLLHDAAQATGQRDEAVAALERGGTLIDRGTEPLYWADYFEQVAEYHLEHARLDRAGELIDEITDIREALQPDQPALGKSLLLWARLLYDKADFEGCAAVARRAGQLYAGPGPSFLTDAAACMSIRGLALLRLGTRAEAEPLLRQALSILETALGPDHPDVAISLNNLASLLLEINRLAEAEPLFRRALLIHDGTYGPDHPSVAIDLGNLAGLLADTSRPAEAEPLLRRALAILERAYGPDHPDVATALNNLAQLFKGTGRPAEAEPLLRRALAIGERASGPDHPDVATRLNNLAQVLQATDRLPEAEPLMRRAAAITWKNFGNDHPLTRITFGNYSWLLHDLGCDGAEIQRRVVDLVATIRSGG